MRPFWIAVVAALIIGQGPALGAGLLLEEEPRTDFTVYGWTFLALTVATLSLASTANSDSKGALDKADASYRQYLTATAPTAIAAFRGQTEKFHEEAKSLEKRANVGAYLALLFGLTSYYSFFPDSLPEGPVLISNMGIVFRLRF